MIGVLTAAVALGAAHLVAGTSGSESSPVYAVGSSLIDASPAWLKEFAIRTFGTNDKPALLIGMGLVVAVIAAAMGVASITRPWIGFAALGGFGAVGAIAAVTRPNLGPEAAVPSMLGAGIGVLTFAALRRAAGVSAWSRSGPPATTRRRRARAPEFDRRRFLGAGTYAAVAAGLSGLAGQYLVRRFDASASRTSVRIPPPADPAPPLPEGVDLRIPGLSTFITPNRRFYRIDTALIVPAVNADDWTLRVHGMVDREITLDYATLIKRPLMERDITLTCVSNEVGGRYISNARWIGVPLKDLLDEAGVHPGADQIVGRSSDGFTVGTPTAVATDGRDSMLAVAMNGEPLPLEHGFPVRMIVPGLYGYVSATKWLVDLELTTFDAYDAYWIQRGWSQRAPIKTESRIDTPRANADVAAAYVPVAGIAWAQHRGISRVEVQVDGGAWEPANLSAMDTADTWRQWIFKWPATTGSHVLAVRATDGDGATQTGDLASPIPNGATGLHTIRVNVH